MTAISIFSESRSKVALCFIDSYIFKFENLSLTLFMQPKDQ
jgi:hypothetical protein